MTVAARPLHGRRERERVDRGEDLFERHTDFEAGQVRAEAEVRAVTEGQVWVGLTLQDERIRFVEASRIPIGRSFPHHHLLSGTDALPTELACSGRRPALGGRGCRPSQDLLHGSVHRCLPGPQEVELLGPRQEGEHGAGNGVAGRLGSR